MRAAVEAVRETLMGTLLMVTGLMFFIGCIYIGLFLNVSFWHWLAGLI